MLRLSDTYANTSPPDASYPYGSGKNETSPGALDGTPYEKAWYDDVIGFFQSVAAAAGFTPSNTADTVLAPQILGGLYNLRYYAQVDYNAGTKAVGSDGVTYVCVQPNGPASVQRDPTTDDGSYWLTETAAMFDALYPVGAYRITDTNESPAVTFGIGTWARVSGQFLVGVDAADPAFDTAGKTGGSKTHSHSAGGLTVEGHSHLVSPQSWQTAHTSNANLGSITFVETAGETARVGTAGRESTSASPAVTGSSEASNGLPPFRAAHIWRRTA